MGFLFVFWCRWPLSCLCLSLIEISCCQWVKMAHYSFCVAVLLLCALLTAAKTTTKRKFIQKLSFRDDPSDDRVYKLVSDVDQSREQAVMSLDEQVNLTLMPRLLTVLFHLHFASCIVLVDRVLTSQWDMAITNSMMAIIMLLFTIQGPLVR